MRCCCSRPVPVIREARINSADVSYLVCDHCWGLIGEPKVIESLLPRRLEHEMRQVQKEVLPPERQPLASPFLQLLLRITGCMPRF